MILAVEVHSLLVFLHVASVFGFLAIHGVSVVVFFKFRKERNPEGLRLLLELSRSVIRPANLFILLVFATGITLAFLDNLWGFL